MISLGALAPGMRTAPMTRSAACDCDLLAHVERIRMPDSVRGRQHVVEITQAIERDIQNRNLRAACHAAAFWPRSCPPRRRRESPLCRAQRRARRRAGCRALHSDCCKIFRTLLNAHATRDFAHGREQRQRALGVFHRFIGDAHQHPWQSSRRSVPCPPRNGNTCRESGRADQLEFGGQRLFDLTIISAFSKISLAVAMS